MCMLLQCAAVRLAYAEAAQSIMWHFSRDEMPFFGHSALATGTVQVSIAWIST